VTITPGDRVGLLGRNGAGKSTLIKLMAGMLEPLKGERLPASDLRVGYFAQHQLEQLDPDRTPLEHLFEIDAGARESDLRKWLGGFGFSGDTVFMPTRPFSGGEKSRLALALLVYRRPNLLLLDEPTNHLDLEMRQALAVALQDFAGAMVIVSHDRHLLRVATDQLLLVDGGRATEFDGSLDDYRTWLSAREQQAQAPTSSEAAPHGRAARQDRRRRDAAERERVSDIHRRLRQAESALAEMARRNSQLEQALADPELYEADNADRLRQCLDRQVESRVALERAEADWLEASEELERLHQESAGET
jgi:ATP-binding cassette subfamily F protein 3